MADIFLSYAREDRVRAEQMAQALESAGLDVFWDNEIPPGRTWADYIEQKLSQCKALIVLWSEESVKSQWVREEARMGRDKGVLIPVMIDAVPAPFGFGELQAADLSSWNGEQDHAGWRRFVDAVRHFANTTPEPAARSSMGSAPPRAQPAVALPEKKKGVPVWAWVAGGVVATIVVLGIIGAVVEDGPDVPPVEHVETVPENPIQAAANPAAAAGPGGAPGGQNYGQQLQERLAWAQQVMSQQGFQQIVQPHQGQLPQGQHVNVPLTLNAGGEYRIIGVCDNDCGNLDLILYDQNNTLISRDTMEDAFPIVAVTPQWTGAFTVQAMMSHCAVQPCYYALALYGRATQ